MGNSRLFHIPLVKPVLFILSPKIAIPVHVYNRIEQSFGSVEFKGKPYLFDCTDYYAKEFGQTLYRRSVCFRTLMNPSLLVEFKWVCSQIENVYRKEENRVYNLDMGYLDTDKLVLASFKSGKNKVYLNEGVYGDMLLEYAKGIFSPMPWAFEDFRDGRYVKDLLIIREKLKATLRR
jgi:hypothetical protein